MAHSVIKQMFCFILIVLFFIPVSFVFSTRVYGQENEFYRELSPRERDVAHKMERIYLRREKAPLRILGDYEVDEDETIRGDVLLAKGTIFVAGEIDGNVLVLFGDVELDSTAYIDGDVIAYDGKVWSNDEATVTGDIIERGHYAQREQSHEYRKSHKKSTYIESRKVHKRIKENHHREQQLCDKSDEGIWAAYSRVDGLTLGLRLPNQGWWQRHRRNFAILGKAGYSFASKRTHYQLGLERWVFDDFRLAIGAEVHDLTDTQDGWIIGDLENALAAAIIKEDFQDYYNRQGYSLYLTQNLGPSITFRGEYRNDEFTNLTNHSNWSLFGKHKRFRPNPPALPDMTAPEQQGLFVFINTSERLSIQGAAASLTIDTRDDCRYPTKGWYVQAFYERAGFDLKSDMDFERYIIDIRRYQPLGWDENLDIRLRAGSATGVLPPMYWFDLGGISTLRGYGFKEFTGDRMVLGNIEYRLRSSGSDWFILDDFDVILFVDSGLAWFANGQNEDSLNKWPVPEDIAREALNTRPEGEFESLDWNHLKTDVGIALAMADDEFRINFARRTDVGGSNIVVTFRISKPF